MGKMTRKFFGRFSKSEASKADSSSDIAHSDSEVVLFQQAKLLEIAKQNQLVVPTVKEVTGENIYGLNPLFTPEELAHNQAIHPPEELFPVDIVAIHGINGHYRNTWTHEKGFCWLDGLATEFSGARVYSYGYPSEIFFSLAKGGIDDWARGLLIDLTIKRRGHERRPIIFICHSMGGIVVKKALNITVVDNNDFDNILVSTQGIIFLATPHGGADVASVASMLASIINLPLNMGLPRVRKESLKTLEKGSNKLFEIAQAFRHHTASFRMYSFYEMNNIPPLKHLIVDNDSSSMHVPMEKPIPMDGCDHRTICRYPDAASNSYQRVLDALRTLVEDAVKKVSEDLLAEDIACLHTLSYLSMKDRTLQTSKPHPNTCKWILSHPTYTRFLHPSQPNSILFIKGHPGTGKSTLLSSLYAHHTKETVHDRQSIILSAFFHGAGDSLQKSPLGMLRALLFQLYEQSLSARQILLSSFEMKKRTGEVWDWQVEELEALLGQILCGSVPGREILIFIDALDEARDESGEKAAAELVGYFHGVIENARRAKSVVRICISCRHYPVVSFGGIDDVISMEESNWGDIDRFVREYLSLQAHDEWSSKVEKERDDLVRAVVRKAEGVFLWASKRVTKIAREINDGTKLDDIQRLVESWSNDLFTLYREILSDNIEDSRRKKALNFLQWVCLAERPLTLSELRHAMACEESATVEDQIRCEESSGYVESDSRMELLVKSLSGGLAEVRRSARGSTVQLFHQSANDFLRANGLKFLFSSTGSNTDAAIEDSEEAIVGRCEDNISRSCLRYLRLGVVQEEAEKSRDDIKGVRERLPFIQYAVACWFLHAQRAEKSGISQAYLEAVFRSPTPLFAVWNRIIEEVDTYNKYCQERGSGLVHLAASSNLHTLVQSLFEAGIPVEATDEYGNTPLHCAARFGHGQMIDFLFDSGANINTKNNRGETALECAAEYGHKPALDLLLKRGAAVDEATGFTGNALQAAAGKGNIQLVRLLIASGAKLETKSGHFGTALQAAAFEGHEDVVKLLVDKGADINTQSGHYGTALQAAICSANIAIVQFLLGHGANVNIQGGRYGNALQAAGRQKPQFASLLLASGASVNARGGEFETALQAAAFGDEDVLQLLLESGADPNIQGGYFGSALHAAAVSSNTEKIRMLLEAGARIDIHGGQGGIHGSLLQAAIYGASEDFARDLIAGGADINEEAGEHATSLQAAMPHCSEKFIGFLLDKGADVNKRGGEHGSPMGAAIFWKRPPIVKLLLKKGADIDMTYPGAYYDALQKAAARGDVGIVKILLDNGANPNTQGGKYGNTLQVAVASRHTAVIELLLDRGANLNQKGGFWGSAIVAAKDSALLTNLLVARGALRCQ